MTNPTPQVIVSDPELLMHDDRLPRGVIAAVGSMGGYYIDLPSLIRERTAMERANDTRTQPWQGEIVPTAFVMRRLTHYDVFGVVPTIEDIVQDERFSGAKMDAAGRLPIRLADAARRGWLYGRWYSSVAPEGEWGCHARCEITSVLDERTFRRYRRRNWAR